ncbi:sugar transport protein 12-like isoform X1 [Glycine soja]|uniref:Sugar transport protein 1 isoform B n=1 Tax=Glycine soja TaxID=3848 RepID=A0A445LZU2_GLYSO|nr:sugar transport protein 12-like isoform X1 [Glycine soja]RZC28818.1 Sugar transport protein 1 isoform B [Glycine soja]|eukprot:XP_025983694.1 sugar transport protein 12 isoform X1 [Glycine max]
MFRSSHYNANVFFTSPKLVAEDIITQQKFMEVPIKYPAKLTLRVVLTCIMAATGGLIFGYDHGVSGGVTSMDSFLKKFFPSVYEKESNVKPSSNQYCKFNSQILTLFTSSLYLSALAAGLGASSITRMLGRRATMIMGGIFFVAGALLNGLAVSIWMLIVGRLLLGFGIGCANQSVPIYVSEMAPYKYRGALNMCFQLSITIGIFVANLFNYYFSKILNGQGWRLSLGLGAVPAFIFVIGSFCLPDSPSSLVERGLHEDAKRELVKIRGTTEVDAEFRDILAASEASQNVKHPWRTLMDRKYRPQLVFAICIPFFQQFTGLNVITFYAPILFRTIGFGSGASLMSAVIIGSFKPVSTLVSILLVDKFGRRTLFLEGGAQMLICQFWQQIIMTIAIAVTFGTNGNPGTLPKWYAIVVVGIICVYVSGFAWSWGPLGWLIPSEIFPLEIRPAAQSITVGVNMISTFFIAQFFTSMLCHMKFGLFIFFGCFVVIMTLFIYKLLPETKGIPLEEMSMVWQKHPIWGKFLESDNPIQNDKMNSKC